jgi:hypothetical protein
MSVGAVLRLHWISAAEAATFATEALMSPTRTRPVVAITTDPRLGRLMLDADELTREIGDRADVVALETGDPTWALSGVLPSRLDVYGGAARIWWPGLSPSSNPYDHPLLMFTASESAVVAKHIIASVRTGDHRNGPRSAGNPIKAPTIQRPASLARGTPTDPWQRIDDEYRVGDVVRGRVCGIADTYVLIEVLPGAALVAHIGELDWGFVRHPNDVVRAGERVNVEILSLQPDRRRGEVSIKRAGMSSAIPAISPGPGKPLFLADDRDETTPPIRSDDGKVAILSELESAVTDRAELMKRLKATNEQLTDLRKELRSSEDRFRALEMRVTGDLDPTSSATSFLTAVRVEYARRVSEGDRLISPLQRMRVGREFLERLRRLNGISVEKVVEVCAQVACMRAREVPARDVHELRAGEGGAPALVRDRDRAKAWRCSLQVNTASARRLHSVGSIAWNKFKNRVLVVFDAATSCRRNVASRP